MSFAWLWGSDELADLALELVVTSGAGQDGSCADEHSTRSVASTHVLALHGSLLASTSPYFKSRLTTWREQHRCSQKQVTELQGHQERQAVKRGRGNGKGRRSKNKSQAAGRHSHEEAFVSEEMVIATPEQQISPTDGDFSIEEHRCRHPRYQTLLAPPAPPSHHLTADNVASSSCDKAPAHLQAAYAHAHVHNTHGSGPTQVLTASSSHHRLPTAPLPKGHPGPPRKPPAPVPPSSSTAQPTPPQPCTILTPAVLAAAQETALQAIAALERVAASAVARCMKEAVASSNECSIPTPHKVSMLEVLSEVEEWLHAPSPLQPAEVCVVQKALAQAAVAVRQQLSQPKHDEQHTPGPLVNMLRTELDVQLKKELKDSHVITMQSSVHASSPVAHMASLYQKIHMADASGSSSIRLSNTPVGAARQGRQTRSNAGSVYSSPLRTVPAATAGAGSGAAGAQAQSEETDPAAHTAQYPACCPSQFDSLQFSAWMSIAAWTRLQHEQPCGTAQQLQPALGGGAPTQATRHEAKKAPKPQSLQASHKKPTAQHQQIIKSKQQQQQQQQIQQQHGADQHKTASHHVDEHVQSIVLASGVKLHHQSPQMQSNQGPAQQQHPAVGRGIPPHWIELQEHCTEEQLPGVLGVLLYMYTGKLPAGATLQELVQILLQADYWSVFPCITACLSALMCQLDREAVPGREAVPLDDHCANLLSLLPSHLVTFSSDPQVGDPQLGSQPEPSTATTQGQQQQQDQGQQGQVQTQKTSAPVVAQAVTEDDNKLQEARRYGRYLVSVLRERLLSAFGKAAAVARSSKLLSQFVALPYLFLHMWAGAPEVLIDSEHTILLLLSRWVEVQQQKHAPRQKAAHLAQRLAVDFSAPSPAGQPPTSEQLCALSKLVRQGLLTSSFILQVLPHLHWYQLPAGAPNNTAQVMSQLAGDRLQRKDWEQALAKHGVVRRSQPGSTLTTHVSDDALHNAWRAAPRGGTARVPLTTQYWGGYVWQPYLLLTHVKPEGEPDEPQDPPGLGVFEVGLQLTCQYVSWLDALKAPNVLQPVAGLQFTVQVGEGEDVSAEHLLGGEPVGPKDVLGEYFMDVHDLMDVHGDDRGRLKVVLSFQSIT